MTDRESAVEMSATASSLERLAERMLRNPESGRDGANSPAPQGDVAVADSFMAESYKGVFAHPEILRQLNDVVQNGAERAFALTEREQQFRHGAERSMIDAEIAELERQAFDRRLIIILLFAFLAIVLVLGFVAVMTNHPLAGASVAALGTLVTVVGGLMVRFAPGARRGDTAPEQ